MADPAQGTADGSGDLSDEHKKNETGGVPTPLFPSGEFHDEPIIFLGCSDCANRPHVTLATALDKRGLMLLSYELQKILTPQI